MLALVAEHAHPLPNNNNGNAIVSAGETSVVGDHSEDTDDEDDDEEHPKIGNDHDLLYDEHLDEEDEAYVYKHMRGGIQEPVAVRSTEQHNRADASAQHLEQQKTLHMYKPRNSDAVLSCPCCFNIVCMDCQKHKKYANQYRAMFVMGVVVDWKHILVYDEENGVLVTKAHNHELLVEEDHGENSEWLRAGDGEYYAVECASCNTQVAALDMKDEVYHFHGCLESSSSAF